MTVSERHEILLRSVAPRMEAQGFSVFISPSADMLPDFLRDPRPDAVAIKDDAKVALQIMTPAPERAARNARLGRALEGHPDWQLRFVSDPADPEAAAVPIMPKAVIEEGLARAERLVGSVGVAAGLLLAWPVFEAAARRLIPLGLARPQHPATLMERLAFDGYVTPDEAAVLREAGRARNGLAHGRLDVPVARDQFDTLVAVTRILLDMDAPPA